jgi:anti-repressor protein
MSNQLPMAINPSKTSKEHILDNLLNCFTFVDTEKQLVIAYPVFLHLGYTRESVQAALSQPMFRQYTNCKGFAPREDFFISIPQIGELIVNAPKDKYIPHILEFIKNTLIPLFNQQSRHDDKEKAIMTTNQLINLYEQKNNHGLIQTVEAREVHKFLEVKTKFSEWIKYRIEQYSFIENEDYVVVPNFRKTGHNSNLGATTKDYYFTLDMAKQLAMVENNAKGHEARKYFIECEKKALNPQVAIPQTYAAALLEAAKLAEESEKLQLENKTLEAKIEADKPKVKLGEMMTMVDATILIGDYAIMLQNEHKIKIGQNRLFAWLRENGYLCKEEKFKNRPTQKSMELELFAWTERIITTNHGSEIIQFTPRITGKGQVYFLERILKDFNEKGRKENAAA